MSPTAAGTADAVDAGSPLLDCKTAARAIAPQRTGFSEISRVSGTDALTIVSAALQEGMSGSPSKPHPGHSTMGRYLVSADLDQPQSDRSRCSSVSDPDAAAAV